MTHIAFWNKLKRFENKGIFLYSQVYTLTCFLMFLHLQRTSWSWSSEDILFYRSLNIFGNQIDTLNDQATYLCNISLFLIKMEILTIHIFLHTVIMNWIRQALRVIYEPYYVLSAIYTVISSTGDRNSDHRAETVLLNYWSTWHSSNAKLTGDGKYAAN